MSLAPDTPCEELGYSIELIKNGVDLLAGQGSSISSINCNRKLDDISTADVMIEVPELDCCGQLGLADAWNTNLRISNNAKELWYGPLRQARFGKNRVQLLARDQLAWATKRIIWQDYAANADSATIAAALWEMCVSDRNAEVMTYPTAIVEDRAIKASVNRKLWNYYQEMLDTSLDVTTFGSRILFGMPGFTPLTVDDTMIQGDVWIVKDGDDGANRIISDASADIQATYPTGPRSTALVNGYPLLEETINDTTIQDEQTAQNAAKARYDFSAMGVRRVEVSSGLVLLPSSGIDPHKLIAGQLINFQATHGCYQAEETFRLSSIEFNVAAGVETTTIDLQPLGAVQGLDTL